MRRGMRLPLEDWQRVDRAVAGLYDTEIQYCLTSGRNGGFDPTAKTCASMWEIKGKTIYSADCVGYALHSYGWDRFQPEFPFWGGYLNTNSICAAADAGSPWVRVLDGPYPGCLVVYPANRKRLRLWGHVGVVISETEVIHCHGPKLRGSAIDADSLKVFTKVKGHRFVELVYPHGLI